MLPSNLIVELTPQELADIAHIAAEVTARAAHIPNHLRYSFNNQVESNRIGLVGEYAVAKLFGLGLDACGMNMVGVAMDGGCDITLPNGMTVQVKAKEVHTNPNRPYWFLLKTTQVDEFTADIGIMVYVLRNDPSRVKIPGYVTRERFRAEHVLVNPRLSPVAQPVNIRKCAAMASCRFDPIEQLIARVNNDLGEQRA